MRNGKYEAESHKSGRGKKLPDDVKPFRADAGNSGSYLLRRMARRAPEILDRYEQGEFKSVRAAAIEAGIRESHRADNLQSGH
jgi:hypothetical protein